MPTKLLIIGGLSALLVLSGCSSSNESTDGGQDAAHDAGGDDPGNDADGAAGDPGNEDGGLKPDYDPTNEFLLEIPGGVSFCHGFHQDRTWQQELAMIGRIDLQPGFFNLPRTPGTYQAELIETVVFGPEHRLLQPTAAQGQFVAEYKSGGLDEWWYKFHQDFTFSGTIYQVEIFLSIGNEGSWPEEISLDNVAWPAVISARIFIGPGENPLDEIQAFGLCALPDVFKSYSATTAGGDLILLEEREGPYMRACQAAGETSCLFLTSASVQSGEFQQTISDRLRLVYAGSHHNWNDQFLLLLDPPNSNVAAILVEAPDFMGNTGSVSYMDADFKEVSQEEIVDWQIQ
ncbi:MAG: hypothetical protein JRJ19_06080 [Deltaproteobacteria bacterium]|nr:hypothetical protein [Deltaproteobacteria bacterium]